MGLIKIYAMLKIVKIIMNKTFRNAKIVMKIII